MRPVVSSIGMVAGIMVALSSCALLFGGSSESDGSSSSVIEPPQQLVATVGAASYNDEYIDANMSDAGLGAVGLDWDAPANTYVLSYRIHRSTEGEIDTPTDDTYLETVTDSVAWDSIPTGYQFRDLQPGVTYYYSIFTASQYSRFSEPAKVQVTFDPADEVTDWVLLEERDGFQFYVRYSYRIWYGDQVETWGQFRVYDHALEVRIDNVSASSPTQSIQTIQVFMLPGHELNASVGTTSRNVYVPWPSTGRSEYGWDALVGQSKKLDPADIQFSSVDYVGGTP